MNKKDLDTIKKRSASGVVVSASVQAVSLVGGLILSILLVPETYGVFTVVAATAAFLSYFSDIGLGAALIQKKKKITKDDLVTTFTIQQILVFSLAIGTILLAPIIASWRDFSVEALWLFRALIIAFILSSFKTIPSLLLERDLQFHKLAIPQTVEVVVFNIVVVTLALADWGIEMFTYAVLARGVAGLITMYVIKPWRPRFRINKKSAKTLISFGVPFQLFSILALVKDNLFVMVLPLFIPFQQIGYIGWAKKWAEFPLRLLMDHIIRVTFPTFSRLQEYPEKLATGINKTMFILLLFVIPISIGMVLIIKPILNIIPEYLKWEPALTSFYLFVIASAVATVSSPLLNAINAIGKVKVTLYFMIFWTIFTWTVTPALVMLIGFNGVALANAFMSLSTIAVVIIARKNISFSLWQQLKPSLVSAILMGVALFLLIPLLSYSLLNVLLVIFIGGLVYFGSLFTIFRKKTLHELNYIRVVFAAKT